MHPGRGQTKTGQLFAYVRDDPPGVAYLYAPDRKPAPVLKLPVRS